MLDLSATERQMALNEVRVLATLDHPNIVTYYDSFERDGVLMIGGLGLVESWARDHAAHLSLVAAPPPSLSSPPPTATSCSHPPTAWRTR